MTDFGEHGLIPVRVRIGVTGHRELPDQTALANRVREALHWIHHHTGAPLGVPVHFTVVSSLAEGADRLVARVVLEADDEAKLEAPLPLDPRDYRNDFKGRASKSEFDELLAKAASPPQVVSTADRPGAYEEAGHYMVDSVNVLIAVWDGRPSRGPGGTAEIIRYAKKRGVPVITIDADFEPGIKYPKRKTITCAVSDYDSRPLGSRRFTAGIESAHRELLGPGQDRAPIALAGLARWIIPYFVRADQLALRYQAIYYHLGTAVFALAAMAVSIGAAQAIFAHSTPGWVWLEVACVALGVGLVVLGLYLRVSTRWLAYRSLAERFRSALFLAVAGVDAPPENEVEWSELEDQSVIWLVDAARDVWNTKPGVKTIPEARLKKLREFLAERWLEGQIRYHEKAGAKHAKRHELVRRFVYVIAFLVLSLGILHATGVVEEGSWPDSLALLTIVLPLVAAAVSGIAEQREFRRHSIRYDQMVRNLRSIKRQMENAESLIAVRRTTLLADAAMREERQDWFGTMVFNTLQVTP